MKVYFCKNKNKQIVKKSSSGGFFSLLANYVIEKNGVVFGATFDKDFNVVISYTENDFSGMLGSKYVKSSIKNSFAECKDFLENDRTVLYSGTPCQIVGLKAYLKKDYDNLITMDVICHGSPIAEIWQHYLKSFNKEIESINFRDKRESWEQYHLTIKFKDGTEFTENHLKNEYMKLFLENKILTEPCYRCQNCKNSKADFTVGDAWAAPFKDTRFNDHQGTSCVISRTNKSDVIFNDLKTMMLYENTNEKYLDTSYGYVHNYSKPSDADKIKKGVLEPKIAMITIPGHNNVGNTLQAFALQTKIKEILPKANPIIINSKYTNYTTFYKNKVKFTTSGFDSSYNFIIVGSDQIWTDEKYINVIPFEDRFLIRNCKKIVYAASFGKHQLNFSNDQLIKIQNSLKTVKYVSTREITGTLICKHYFKYNTAVSVLDPTMLYDKEFYLNSINEKPAENKLGIFVYVLDKNNEWNKQAKEISDKLRLPILKYDGTVESFIRNMNNASCVITDSYHGTVFSLIFNNPFITLTNEKRGNDRFEDLSLRFDFYNRFIDKLSKIDLELLTERPNVIDKIHSYRTESISFLSNGLKQF